MKHSERVEATFREIQQAIDQAGLKDHTVSAAIVRSLQVVAESTVLQAEQVDKVRTWSRWVGIAGITAGLLGLGAAGFSWYSMKGLRDLEARMSVSLTRIDLRTAELQDRAGQIQDRAAAIATENRQELQRQLEPLLNTSKQQWQIHFTSNGVPFAAPAGVVLTNPSATAPGTPTNLPAPR